MGDVSPSLYSDNGSNRASAQRAARRRAGSMGCADAATDALRARRPKWENRFPRQRARLGFWAIATIAMKAR